MNNYQNQLLQGVRDYSTAFLKLFLIIGLCSPFWSCGGQKVSSAVPSIDVQPNVAAGSYSEAQKVGFVVTALKSDADLEVAPVSEIDVYYTLDGTEPSEQSNVIKLDVSKSVSATSGLIFASDENISISTSSRLMYFAVLTCDKSEEKKSATGQSQLETSPIQVKSDVASAAYVISAAASATPTPTATASSGSSDSGSSGSLTYSVTKPSYLPGNITFTSNADSVACSSDGGSSYADCSSAGLLAVSAAGYDAGTQYRVKFTKGSSVYESTWTPKTEVPGLTMSGCNIGVVQNLTKTAFEALWQNGTDATHRYKVCLADDVVINGSPSANVTISATNIELVGSNTSGHRSTVHRLAITGAGSGNRANITGGTYQGGIVAQGTITKVFDSFWARGNDRNGVYISGATMNLTLSNCDIDMTNSLGVTQSVYGDDTATYLTLAISSCSIKNTGSGSFGNEGMYFRGYGSNLTIQNSSIEIATNNYAYAFRLHQTITASLTDTTVTADASADGALYANVTNTLSLTRVTVATGQRGLKFGTSNNTVNIGNSVFKQTGGTDRMAFDLANSSTQTINDTSVSGGNLFCYVSGSATSFLAILSSTPSAGTFTAAGTLNGDNYTFNTCP